MNKELYLIEYIPKSGKNNIYEQIYKGENLRLIAWLKDVVDFKDDRIYKKDLQGTLWNKIDLNNLTKEGDIKFSNGKKPEFLIKRIIDMATNDEDIVLDFNFGSGTTGAVAHKMGRRYIGIEQMDYIHDLTIPRLQKVIEGEQGGISKDIDWKGGGSFVYMELMEENQKYINQIISIQSTEELQNIFDEIINNGYLNYQIDVKKLVKDMNKKCDEEIIFYTLSLEEQKKIMIEILDKNQLYVSYSEIEDENLGIDEKTKQFNRSFYEIGKE